VGIASAVRRLRGKAPSKGDAEMDYWRERFEEEGGRLANGHYQEVFTAQFNLTPDDFAGKRVLDIGCGPRGSLEWATMAAERVGVDPLVDTYRELGIESHEMTYLSTGAESIPRPDGSFDVITTLNSLDHVDDVEQTIAELTRLAADDALLLLTVEVGHEPTPTEPHAFDWDVVDRFEDWTVEWSRRNGLREDHQIYKSLQDELPYEGGPGLLRARLRKHARV
jgi:SAM-dependent methyltransferase